MASDAKAEVRGLFQNGQTAVPLRITLNELCFTQPPTPIKTDDSAAEVIDAATSGQEMSKAMDMQFYLMKSKLKLKNLCILETRMSKHGGLLHKISSSTSL